MVGALSCSGGAPKVRMALRGRILYEPEALRDLKRNEEALGLGERRRHHSSDSDGEDDHRGRRSLDAPRFKV